MCVKIIMQNHDSCRVYIFIDYISKLVVRLAGVEILGAASGY